MTDTKLPDTSYFSSAELDAFARIQTELLSELWVLRDRVMVLESLLEQHGVLKRDQIDHHQPSVELEQKLKSERDKMVTRVLNAGQRKELKVEEIVAKEVDSKGI